MPCNEPSEGLLLDKFIVDGFQHTDLPVSWDQNTNEFGIRSISYPGLDIRRIVVAQDARATESDPLAEYRKVLKQAWTGTWSEQSPMSKCLYDQLKVLYTIQKHFYIQFDDEMSHDPGFLTCPDQKYMSYFTPTYPIKPLGYTPSNTSVSHVGNLAIIGQHSSNIAFNVDNELGRVTFCTALTAENQVVLRYTWRCRVRIVGMNLAPFELNQTYYRGTVQFEQVSPNASIDPWWPLVSVCSGTCSDSLSEFNFSHGELSTPSIPDKSQASSGSRPSFASNGSGGSAGTGSSSGSSGSNSSVITNISQVTQGTSDAGPPGGSGDGSNPSIPQLQ